MRIKELLEGKNYDDVDDEREEVPTDPDADKVPHILMQIKKVLDLGGSHPIVFQSGEKATLTPKTTERFLKIYFAAKPVEREKIQNQAIQSIDGFKSILDNY